MSCSGSGETSTEGTETEEVKEFAFQCPMKCEGSGSNSAGKCSVCKMDLVEIK